MTLPSPMLKEVGGAGGGGCGGGTCVCISASVLWYLLALVSEDKHV